MTSSFWDVDPEESLRDELAGVITRYADANPRHHQSALGPSEIGHPCHRKMAYRLLGVGRCNPQFDCLPSTIGVATHAWLQDAAEADNVRLGRKRWWAETRVEVAPGLSGSCDLYDADTGTVIDWKLPGVNRFAAYKKDPGVTYRMQIQLYALGFRRLGMPVERVSIMFLPRGGTLGSAHLYSEPYDEKVAKAAVARLNYVIQLLNDLEVEKHPERFEWLEKSGHDCVFCPWWSPKPNGPLQCVGMDTQTKVAK